MYVRTYICRWYVGALTLAAKCERNLHLQCFSVKGSEIEKGEKERERERILEEADNTQLFFPWRDASIRSYGFELVHAGVFAVHFVRLRNLSGFRIRSATRGGSDEERETRNERERKETRIRDA